MDLDLGRTVRRERAEFAAYFDDVSGLRNTVMARADMLDRLAASWIEMSSGETQDTLRGLLGETKAAVDEANHLESLVDQAIFDGIEKAKSHQLSKAAERLALQTNSLHALDRVLDRVSLIGHQLMSAYFSGPARASRYVSLIARVIAQADMIALRGEHVQPTREQLIELGEETKNLMSSDRPSDPIVTRGVLDRIRMDIDEAMHQLQVDGNPSQSHNEWSSRLLDGVELEWVRIRKLRSDDRLSFGKDTKHRISDWCDQAAQHVENTHSLLVKATSRPTSNRNWEEVSGLLDLAGLELIQADSVLNRGERYLQVQVLASRKAQPLVSDLGTTANLLVNLASEPGQRLQSLSSAVRFQRAALELSERLSLDYANHLAIAAVADVLSRGVSQQLQELGAPTRVWSEAQLNLERNRARNCIHCAKQLETRCADDQYDKTILDELSLELERLSGSQAKDPLEACRIAEQANSIYWSIAERRQHELTWSQLEQRDGAERSRYRLGLERAIEQAMVTYEGPLGGSLRGGSFSEFT